VLVIALNGMAFDLGTPHGRMIATVLAGIAEFERDLIQERIRSGIAAAKARETSWSPAGTAAEIGPPRAKGSGARRPGSQLRPGRPRTGAYQNTVADIVKRDRATPIGI
jgi:DNA invertase Pin-like site-specific DNA recombinase